MNFVNVVAFLLLRILSIDTSNIVSEEKYGDTHQSKDHIQQTSKSSERRFTEDLDDNEWHVSHLKDVDFHVNANCKEETFTDKVKKYRKTLKEDGSLVDYVSPYVLPASHDVIIKDKCATFNKTIKKIVKLKKSNKKNETNVKDEVITKEVNIATTAGLDNIKTKAKAHNVTEEEARRANEYQFSSAEYYDEVDEVQDAFCPEFVEVIHLEIDTLRNYDVECELMLEWRSLE